MTARAGLRLVIALAAVVVAAGSLSLFRSGYSPDEEFTLFAVRGIRAHGLPLLPSGLLYDRGLLYSYASWIAAVLSGAELPAFRALSLFSSAAALMVIYTLFCRTISPAAGAVAAVLVSASLPFWAAATTGRFYAPFLLASVLVVAVFAQATRKGEPDAAVATGPLLALFGLGFVARLIHELAFTLLAIPTAALIFHPHSLRHLRYPWPLGHLRQLWSLRRLRSLGGLSAALIAGLVVAQALLMTLHFVRSESGGSTMIERFFFWQVLNLFERPHGLPFGLIGAAVLVSWLLAPARARPASILGAAAALLVLLAGWVSAAIALPLSAALLPDMAAAGLAYPLDMFWHLANTRPMMVWSALALLVARLCGAGGSWPPRERAAHLAWVGWVLWFGVIDSGITINYVLLPTACLLAAIGIDLVALGQQAAGWPGPRAHVVQAALAGAALLVTAEQWAGPGSMAERLAAARSTIQVEGIERIRAALAPEDLVACTDELACALMVGRVDRWLALDDFVRERFLVQRGPDLVGVYAGAPAVFRPADLLPGQHRATRHRIIIVDVFKEYPVGNSRTWLPLALAKDGTEYRELLLTSQARVVELREAGSGAESHR